MESIERLADGNNHLLDFIIFLILFLVCWFSSPLQALHEEKMKAKLVPKVIKQMAW